MCEQHKILWCCNMSLRHDPWCGGSFKDVIFIHSWLTVNAPTTLARTSWERKLVSVIITDYQLSPTPFKQFWLWTPCFEEHWTQGGGMGGGKQQKKCVIFASVSQFWPGLEICVLQCSIEKNLTPFRTKKLSSIIPLDGHLYWILIVSCDKNISISSFGFLQNSIHNFIKTFTGCLVTFMDRIIVA